VIGIGVTELIFMIIIVGLVLWMVRRNRNQQEKQQKKAVGWVLVGALVGSMVVLYVFLHHP
jgi:uncharacterized membrane protein